MPDCIAAAIPIDVGSQSQLFVDRHLIESEKAIELVVHPPRKMERVLVPERPWEAYRVFVQSVLRDGIHWEKPDLDLREFDGNKSNNLIPNAGPVVSMIPESVEGMRFLSLPADDDVVKLTGSRDGRLSCGSIFAPSRSIPSASSREVPM